MIKHTKTKQKKKKVLEVYLDSRLEGYDSHSGVISKLTGKQKELIYREKRRDTGNEK